MKTKKCTNKNCKQPEKPLSEFAKNKNRGDGLNLWCKKCHKELYHKRKFGDNKRCKFCSCLILKTSDICKNCNLKLQNFIEKYKRKIYKEQIKKIDLSNISIIDKQINKKHVHKYLLCIGKSKFYSQYKNLIDKEFINIKGWEENET